MHDTLLFVDLGKIFFRLLRPELVAQNKKPLSSDSFSGFGSCKTCFQAS